MSIYADIAASVLGVLPDFTVGGPEWTVYRPAGDGVSAPVVAGPAGPEMLFIVRNTGSRMQQSAPSTSVWASDWLLFAALGVDVRAGDVVSDDVRAFVLTATPETDYAMTLAPVEPAPVPA